MNHEIRQGAEVSGAVAELSGVTYEILGHIAGVDHPATAGQGHGNEEDGYGGMTAPCVCEHCGAELVAEYTCLDGYEFTGFKQGN